MSATADFDEPEITADDYYNRLGAPASADASDIDNHTKKYVAQFKPELSTHENADERWKRFNDARQTLNSPDSKADYDTFRERFGPERAAEAYSTWQANDALGSPDTVTARELGLEAEVDETEGRESQRDRSADGRSSSRQRRQNRASREERQEERARRRRAGETDIDTDTSKTYSTRTTGSQGRSDSERTTDTEPDTEQEKTASQSTVKTVLSHLRTSVDLAASELSTLLSMIELGVIAYLVYVVIVEVGAGSLSIAVAQDGITVLLGFAAVILLGREYLDRFSASVAPELGSGDDDGVISGPAPGRIVILPVLSSVLWGLVLLVGGGALTIVLFGVSVLSLYGRVRLLRATHDLPTWTQYLEPVAGGITGLLFIALFIQTGTGPTGGGVLGNAEVTIIAAVGVALLALIAAPLVGIKDTFSA